MINRKQMLSLLTALSIGAAAGAQKPFTVAVWPGGAAENNGIRAEEKLTESGHYINARTAELYVYLPEKAVNTGAVVIICPGGGYTRQAMQHEGIQFAEMLQKKGVAGIILKYRLPNGHHAIPLADAAEAVRIVRAHAAEWGIAPDKVGIAGFSAGGHLASTLGTHYTTESRPDFMLLFYPVVTMKEFTHKGSRDNLLGAEKDNAALIDLYSNELHVTADTPPALFLLSDDDKSVPPANSVQMYAAMKKAGVAASMHIFATGGHGWGCRPSFAYYDSWQSLMWKWLTQRGIISSETK